MKLGKVLIFLYISFFTCSFCQAQGFNLFKGKPVAKHSDPKTPPEEKELSPEEKEKILAQIVPLSKEEMLLMQLTEQEEIISQRYIAIKEIKKEAEVVKEMFEDLARLTAEQGKMINVLYENTAKTKSKMRKSIDILNSICQQY